MDEITPIKNIVCPKCFFCKTETSKQSGEWGQDVWISHYCKYHNIKTDYENTCKKFKPKL